MLGAQRFIMCWGEVKTLTGGPLGPMMDRPGSPGAPCGQKHEEEK